MYENAKNDLIEIFKFGIHKLKNNACTQEEMAGIMRSIEENIPIHAELDDLAEFYGKSKTAVSSQIKRNLYDKPRKNVTLYPFLKVRKILPLSWRKRH